MRDRKALDMDGRVDVQEFEGIKGRKLYLDYDVWKKNLTLIKVGEKNLNIWNQEDTGISNDTPIFWFWL